MNDDPNQLEAQVNAPDLTGAELGDYLLLRRLGSGGMAHVYLAEQKSLQRKVALKILRPELVSDAAHVTRFLHEARSAASLSQSNIVQIYEVGQCDGKHYIAQEYVAGKNLKQYLTRFGAVEVVMALNILRQVGLALQKAEESRIVHRDIKPENIMLSSSGEMKVTDFGLARIANEKARLNLTQIGVTLGTPLYMSPEQIEGRDVDPRTDIYSLGVTIYHVLAGEPPYDGETALAVAMKHINSPVPELKKVRPDVPQELSDLVLRMMAKLPEDRVQNASELLKLVRKIKVDADEDWVSLAQKIAEGNDGNETSTSGSMAATRQLHSILKGNVRSFWTSRSFLLPTILLALLSIATGVAVAFMQPVPQPLSVTPPIGNGKGIPRKDTVKEQFRLARWGGTPAHYQAVIDYFPAEPTDFATLEYHYHAKQRLGESFLDSNDFANAQKYFFELTRVDDMFMYYQAVGHAGLACVYDRAGLVDEARAELAELENLSIQNGSPFVLLFNESLRDRVDELIDRYYDPL